MTTIKETFEAEMGKDSIYAKALEGAKPKKNENDRLVLFIQASILGFALYWEVRKLLKGEQEKGKK